MAYTTPSTRPAIWAESGQVTAPSTGEQQSGYVAGKPSRRKTNWLLAWFDNAVQYLLNRGLPDYNADLAYVVGDVVRGSDNEIYKCIQANDSGAAKDPTTQAAYWTLLAPAVTSTDASAMVTTATSGASISSAKLLKIGKYRRLTFTLQLNASILSAAVDFSGEVSSSGDSIYAGHYMHTINSSDAGDLTPFAARTLSLDTITYTAHGVDVSATTTITVSIEKTLS